MNSTWVYTAAWRIVPRLPLRLVEALAGVVGDVVATLGGESVALLRANHARLLGREPTRAEVRAAVRSHVRNYAQQFALPGLDLDHLDLVCDFRRHDELIEMSRSGPVVFALTHSGNWDYAGAWAGERGLLVLTVAERLEPTSLFDAFVSFREGLGMEIIGAGKGEHVFGTLVERARGRSALIPLLADRDVSGSGIEVDLAGHRALVGAGPAALAQKLGRPLVAGVLHYEHTAHGWKSIVDIVGPIENPGAGGGRTAVENHTQAWVDSLIPLWREHVVDWHMMQRVFVEDLDPARLARARERHRREEGEQ